MKKLVFLFVCLFVVVVATENVNAQPTKSVEVTATANIITPINITKSAELSFGNIIASTTAGEVIVDYNNTRTQTGGATFPSIDGSISAAQFEVTGFANALYSITLPEDNVVKLTGNGVDMNITDFEHNADEKLGNNGKETFKIKAKLQVNAGQEAGEYSNTFDVTVNYN